MSLRDPLTEIWPEPPESAYERLQFVIKNFEDEPDSTWVSKATVNLYGEGETTGLTVGDLKQLMRMIQALKAGG